MFSDLSEVTNLKVDQISDGALQINWDKPTYTGNCVLEYLVSIRFDDEQHTFEARTSDTNLEAVIDIKPCSKFEVSVTPISPKGRKGLTLTEKNTANLFREFSLLIIINRDLSRSFNRSKSGHEFG